MSPRQGKRGRSSMCMDGTSKPLVPAATNCRNVSRPCSAPDTVGAFNTAPSEVTSKM